ncbi:unannotated protein [freshwater metagenome]|uniref:Unannotated protein n=2 Tax=freshwater metagenome TaxID=449393 RepID=A0A6J6VX71_9ZZZZ|nr:hypothetical protein [Actinomycetota bacterium]MSY73658.1 hypothetical protein [Actinomycetota bacterium]
MSDQSATPRGAGTGDQPQSEQLLRRVIDVIEAARPMPLSSDSRINKEEVLELLNESVDRLPDELRAARWLLKEREEFLAKVRREGDEILELARARAERMVERTEIVRAAEQRARSIIDSAESEARRMRHEVEDFCDRKLGSFEIVLQKTLKLVGQGRARMQGVPANTPESALLDLSADQVRAPEPEAPFFDQDRS